MYMYICIHISNDPLSPQSSLTLELTWCKKNKNKIGRKPEKAGGDPKKEGLKGCSREKKCCQLIRRFGRVSRK